MCGIYLLNITLSADHEENSQTCFLRVPLFIANQVIKHLGWSHAPKSTQLRERIQDVYNMEHTTALVQLEAHGSWINGGPLPNSFIWCEWNEKNVLGFFKAAAICTLLITSSSFPDVKWRVLVCGVAEIKTRDMRTVHLLRTHLWHLTDRSDESWWTARLIKGNKTNMIISINQ